MKKFLLMVSVLTTTVLLFGCGDNNSTINGGRVKGEIGTDICKEFSADFVYSATGKPIVKVEASPIAGIFRCEYYTVYQANYYKLPNGKASPGGQYISIQLENALGVEAQKKGLEALGRTLKEDPSIQMDHVIAVQENGSINVIDLILSPMSFISIDRSDTKVLTNEEDIAFAAKVAEKLNGKLSFKVTTNPVDTTTAEEKATASESSHQQIVQAFIDALIAKDIQKGLAMMDANEGTKQARGVNFNTIQSLKVDKIEEVFKEEWTAEHQVFKVTLDAKVTAEGEQYNWAQGKNVRRISVQKQSDGNRLIHELANNP